MQIKQIRLQKQQVFIIVGFLLIAIAVVLIQLYLDQERRLAMKYATEDASKKLRSIQEGQATVLVAARNIAAGTLIDPDMLGSKIVLGPDKESRAVTSLARVDGMVAVTSINKGEQITLDKVMYPRRGGLAESTPSGKRAITISVDNVSSLLGMIKPGDYVDIIATLGIPVQGAGGKQVTQTAVIPLFQNVLVLAVGQEIAASMESKTESRYKPAEKKEPSSPLITVALSPQEANLIAFVQEQGKIRLVLRSPMDSQTQPIQPASWDTLFQYIMPQQTKVEPAGDTIEIYRGLNKKDTITLSQ